MTTHSGTIHFTESFYLINVQYLPNFNFNLISISKLVTSLNCKLTFYATQCFIQDTINQKMISIVNVNDGLYKFQMQSIVGQDSSSLANFAHSTFSCNKMPFDLSHYRLGHPSHDRILVMKANYPDLSINKSIVCDACHRAKQKKLVFPNNTSRAFLPFALIYVNIQGPCAIPSIHGHKYFLTIVDDHTRYVWVFPLNSKADT